MVDEKRLKIDGRQRTAGGLEKERDEENRLKWSRKTQDMGEQSLLLEPQLHFN